MICTSPSSAIPGEDSRTRSSASAGVPVGVSSARTLIILTGSASTRDAWALSGAISIGCTASVRSSDMTPRGGTRTPITSSEWSSALARISRDPGGTLSRR